MRHITSRIRAAIGAAIVIAVASPVAAHAQRPAARVRVEAQWIGRRDAAWRPMRWRMAYRPMTAIAWRRGYLRGYVAPRRPFPAVAWRRGYARAVVRGRVHGRGWGRRFPPRMGRRWYL